jgi:hypothetical protein
MSESEKTPAVAEANSHLKPIEDDLEASGLVFTKEEIAPNVEVPARSKQR